MLGKYLITQCEDKQPKGKKVSVKAEPVKEVEKEPVPVYDKLWANAFVDGSIKLIDGGMYKTRDEIVGFYKENSTHVGTLKDKFPEHKKLLDDHIKDYISKIK